MFYSLYCFHIGISGYTFCWVMTFFRNCMNKEHFFFFLQAFVPPFEGFSGRISPSRCTWWDMPTMHQKGFWDMPSNSWTGFLGMSHQVEAHRADLDYTSDCIFLLERACIGILQNELKSVARETCYPSSSMSNKQKPIN